jgi:hypothetical protein
MQTDSKITRDMTQAGVGLKVLHPFYSEQWALKVSSNIKEDTETLLGKSSESHKKFINAST